MTSIKELFAKYQLIEPKIIEINIPCIYKNGCYFPVKDVNPMEELFNSKADILKANIGFHKQSDNSITICNTSKVNNDYFNHYLPVIDGICDVKGGEWNGISLDGLTVENFIPTPLWDGLEIVFNSGIARFSVIFISNQKLRMEIKRSTIHTDVSNDVKITTTMGIASVIA